MKVNYSYMNIAILLFSFLACVHDPKDGDIETVTILQVGLKDKNHALGPLVLVSCPSHGQFWVDDIRLPGPVHQGEKFITVFNDGYLGAFHHFVKEDLR